MGDLRNLRLYQTSKDLQKCSRKYNNIFSMSAIGATGYFETKKTGLSNVTLHGRSYHRMLNGNDDSGPLRWFLNDGQYAKNSASEVGANLEIVEKLRLILWDCNPLLKEFKRLAEDPVEEARLELSVNSSEEIAAIIIPDRNDLVKKKTIVCWKKTTNKPTFIQATNPLYMPLHYVLICPLGTPGWNSENSKQISMLIFYRQIILRCKTLHMLARLFNEFCVDIFSAIENNRLGWVRHNQQKIMKKMDLPSTIAAADSQSDRLPRKN